MVGGHSVLSKKRIRAAGEAVCLAAGVSYAEEPKKHIRGLQLPARFINFDLHTKRSRSGDTFPDYWVTLPDGRVFHASSLIEVIEWIEDNLPRAPKP